MLIGLSVASLVSIYFTSVETGIQLLSIHPYDPDEALVDQIELTKHLKEKESYRFMTYLDLLELESSPS